MKWVLLLAGANFIISANADLLSLNSVAVRQSYYTTRLPQILSHWPPATVELKDPRPVIVRAIRTPAQPDMIGFIKHFTVHFPIEKVVAQTEGFEAYPKLWENVDSVKILARDQDHVLTDWVRKAPAFFLAKIRYKMLYTIDKSTPDKVIYHQQLVDGNSINTTDALVVLEKLGPAETRISVIDFYDANFTAFRSLIEGKIWKSSIESTFKDDIAFSSKLEHPDWTVDQLEHEANRVYDEKPFDDVPYTDLIHFP